MLVRDGLPKKIAVLLDFVQMRGAEGPAQIFCPLFTNCIYWDNLEIGREGETPPQILGTLALKKSGTTCPKNPKEQLLFFGRPSLRESRKGGAEGGGGGGGGGGGV